MATETLVVLYFSLMCFAIDLIPDTEYRKQCRDAERNRLAKQTMPYQLTTS